MTELEFTKHVEYCKRRIDRVFFEKNREYNRENNPFHSFDRAASVSGQRPEEALFGFWLKHIVSILDILDDVEAGKWPKVELLAEKTSDNINYLDRKSTRLNSSHVAISYAV